MDDLSQSRTPEALASDRITVNPAVCGGRPTIRGLRIRVTDVLGMLAAGMSRAEILADYSYLQDEDITAALSFASQLADRRIIKAVDA